MARHDSTVTLQLRMIAALAGPLCLFAGALRADETARLLPDDPPAPEASSTNLDLAPARIETGAQPAQAAKPETTSEPTTIDTSPARLRFGDAGTTWMTLGGGAADNGKDVDFNLFFTVERFIAKDVEVFGEIGGWQYSQPGPDATGFNLAMVVRWHFIDREKWTVYGDVGIGVLFATDPVPRRDGVTGTNFDFTPRAGVGFTRELTDEGVRLEVGLRWAHVSNARISGNDQNPGRDSAMLYTGLIFPF